MYEQDGPSSSARVDIKTNDLVTWQDAFQFVTAPSCCTGPTGPNWTLTGTFQWDIKANNWNAASPEPSLSLTSNGATGSLIVIDDPINLVLQANVSPAILTGATAAAGATGPGLLPGEYSHALRMNNTGASPVIVVELLHGKYYLKHGV